MDKTVWLGFCLIVFGNRLERIGSYWTSVGSYSALSYPNDPNEYMLSGSFGNNYAGVNYYSPFQSFSYVQQTDGYGTRSSYYNVTSGNYYPSSYYPGYYARYPTYNGYNNFYPYYYR